MFRKNIEKSKILLGVSCLIILVLTSSCRRDSHFISDPDYRHKVELQFEKRKAEAAKRSVQLFGVFDQDISRTEEEALKFLYAYMPLSDLADYDGVFYLKNVRASLSARDTFSWGNKVPENLFRHFVLPIRVNNENLDSSRWVFFMELKDRIKHLEMKQAVLEVNHWCHEKVIYRGTDGRTSAPLSTVKTAYGRCGEESTFAVAALRSVGIPARQCYTPRWAHSDDNHAWVEVWVDSSWHYIGACEPEAALDVAWFTAPAKRAMLVNTNVFGDYEGPEDVLVKDPLFTRINILANYAPTKRLYVRTLSELNLPVDSASVEFQLYNYAEFYPLHKTFTDKKGFASLLTGLGDLVVWAAKGDKYGYRKVSVAIHDTVDIMLNLTAGKEYSDAFDLVPPSELQTGVLIQDSAKAENAKRLVFEDKIRENYESTFIDSVKSYRLAATLKVNPDTLWTYLSKSRGNWREIIDFIAGTTSEQKPWVFPLLSAISEKDLRDITPEVLSDNICNTLFSDESVKNRERFVENVLSPRVDNEWLRPFKGLFKTQFLPSFVDSARNNPAMITEWIKSSILVDKVSNYGRAPLTPIGSFQLGIADPHSRDILFVALCRSFGIAARLEPGTKVPQFFSANRWSDVLFENPAAADNDRAMLVLNTAATNDRKPEYHTHFTLEQFDKGFFRSLDYETDTRLQTFPCQLELTPGYYLMVTGNRVEGRVLVNLNSFNLENGRRTEQTITIRKNATAFPVLGKVDVNKLANEIAPSGSVKLKAGKGLVIAWMEPDKEPTRHFVADLKLKARELSEWNGNILLLFPSDRELSSFLNTFSRELPAGIFYLITGKGTAETFGNKLSKSLGTRLPVITYIKPGGEVLYLSEGYRIGIGDELMRLIR